MKVCYKWSPITDLALVLARVPGLHPGDPQAPLAAVLAVQDAEPKHETHDIHDIHDASSVSAIIAYSTKHYKQYCHPNIEMMFDESKRYAPPVGISLKTGRLLFELLKLGL